LLNQPVATQNEPPLHDSPEKAAGPGLDRADGAAAARAPPLPPRPAASAAATPAASTSLAARHLKTLATATAEILFMTAPPYRNPRS
jgi:hypothetical protein